MPPRQKQRQMFPLQINGPRDGHMQCAFELNDHVVLTLNFTRLS